MFPVESSLADTPAAHILAHLPNPVFVLGPDNEFRYLNHAAEMLFQSSLAILRDRRLDSYIPADSPLFSMLARARSQMASVADQGVEVASPRIGLKLLNIQISPYAENVDDEGSLLVTFQERSLAERLRGQSLFHGAARSISAMAALLAHEVKNPLAGIKGAAQLLQGDLPADQHDLTRMIVEETDRVAALLDRMEGFAGGTRVKLTPLNIHEVLDHCLQVASASYGAHLSIKRQYDPSLPPMDGNRDLLIQAFSNIIKNAAEATEKNGEITIVTSYSRLRRMSAATPSQRTHVPVQVEVIDDGVGIPEDIRDHIFDPFVTKKTGGSGLGLAMVASVVADHGGMVEVESMPGATLFRTNFPVASAGAAPMQPVEEMSGE